MKLQSQTITAVAATVTAIAAVAIAAWDNVQTREHNRLSVSPRLTIDLSRSTTPAGTRYAFIVRNDGIGPAIVTDMEIRFDGGGDGAAVLSEWAPVIRPLEAAGLVVNQFWEFAPGDAVAVDRTFTLLGIEERDADSASPLDETVRRLQIAIDYESVYGDSLRSEYEFTP